MVSGVVSTAYSLSRDDLRTEVSVNPAPLQVSETCLWWWCVCDGGAGVLVLRSPEGSGLISVGGCRESFCAVFLCPGHRETAVRTV